MCKNIAKASDGIFDNNSILTRIYNSEGSTSDKNRKDRFLSHLFLIFLFIKLYTNIDIAIKLYTNINIFMVI